MDGSIEITATGADVKHLAASEVGIPWSNSPVFERQLARVAATEEQRALARSFHQDGYLVLEDWIAPELCDRIVADSEGFYDPRAEYPDLPPQVVTLLKQGLEQAHSCRVQDAWWVSEAVKALACDPRILELLQFLYQRAPIPFQTLNFPVGSEQATHADTIHFDSIPSMFMCGVWVALQDVGPDDGPVFYHRAATSSPSYGWSSSAASSSAMGTAAWPRETTTTAIWSTCVSSSGASGRPRDVSRSRRARP